MQIDTRKENSDKVWCEIWNKPEDEMRSVSNIKWAKKRSFPIGMRKLFLGCNWLSGFIEPSFVRRIRNLVHELQRIFVVAFHKLIENDYFNMMWM